MDRRQLLVLFALPLLAAPLAARARAPAVQPPTFQPDARDSADLARIQAYLNTLRSLKAHFLQVAPNGAITQGTAWLERPGKMRFQYDPPAPYLLVAGFGMLVFHDSQLNQTTNIPISQTPLGILLSDNVTLSGDVTVIGMQHLPGQIQVSLIRTGRAGDGTLTLVFADDPLALKQWTVLDAQRQETRVTLYNVELGGNFDSKLFNVNDPRFVKEHGGGGG
jgi:outer membrane lipoprotein-sorting protein